MWKDSERTVSVAPTGKHNKQYSLRLQPPHFSFCRHKHLFCLLLSVNPTLSSLKKRPCHWCPITLSVPPSSYISSLSMIQNCPAKIKIPARLLHLPAQNCAFCIKQMTINRHSGLYPSPHQCLPFPQHSLTLLQTSTLPYHAPLFAYRSKSSYLQQGPAHMSPMKVFLFFGKSVASLNKRIISLPGTYFTFFLTANIHLFTCSFERTVHHISIASYDILNQVGTQVCKPFGLSLISSLGGRDF